MAGESATCCGVNLTGAASLWLSFLGRLFFGVLFSSLRGAWSRDSWLNAAFPPWPRLTVEKDQRFFQNGPGFVERRYFGFGAGEICIENRMARECATCCGVNLAGNCFVTVVFGEALFWGALLLLGCSSLP
jgi:hypothetical protein